MAVRNIKLTIAYDGSSYHGWQIQPGQQTIQGLITDAICALTGSCVTVTGASRTDAGVSALAQAALVKLDTPIPIENLAKAITDRLPPDIAVTEAVEVGDTFDIIGAVRKKLYRYTIFTGPVRPVLQIKHCWHIPAKLDIEAMKRAAERLIGKKDFRSFASAADKRESSVRTIFSCDVTCCEEWVYIDVAGDGFLYNMVRNIVGTLAEVGRGRFSAEKMDEIITAKNRTAAGPIAPASGLCLMWIKY
ncbi:MAG TPA: tRNA pseudouridine(38-40) synthase TruA [Sedimentisphaerales bacterium]|nr:tRNA pseudouridine(38-40) synthase TruA [Sedimentisphaerales bacterium]